jgi:hypothetical protein
MMCCGTTKQKAPSPQPRARLGPLATCKLRGEVRQWVHNFPTFKFPQENKYAKKETVSGFIYLFIYLFLGHICDVHELAIIQNKVYPNLTINKIWFLKFLKFKKKKILSHFLLQARNLLAKYGDIILISLWRLENPKTTTYIILNHFRNFFYPEKKGASVTVGPRSRWTGDHPWYSLAKFDSIDSIWKFKKVFKKFKILWQFFLLHCYERNREVWRYFIL